MNHECYGDFFTADGVRYYRCFKNGTVIAAIAARECQVCERPINANERGVCETIRITYAIFKGGASGKGKDDIWVQL